MQLPTKQTAFLYFTTCIVNLHLFAAVICSGWTSSSIPRLNGHKDPEDNPLGYPITTYEESLLTTIYLIGGIVGQFTAALCIDRLGRKLTILIFTTPLTISFLLKAFATNINVYYCARFLGGFGGGAGNSILPIFLGEISGNKNRGALSAIHGAVGALGSLFAYSVGSYTSIKWFSLSGLIAPCILYVSLIFFIPDTPYYYAIKNQDEEALDALKKIRTTDVNAELQIIKKTLENSKDNKQNLLKGARNSRPFKSALLIIIIISLIKQSTGAYPIFYNLHDIFNAAGNKLSSEISAVVIGCIKLFAYFLSFAWVDKFGRRFILFVAGTGIFISLLALGAFFLIKDANYNTDSIAWLPLLSLASFEFSFHTGMATMPFLLMSEMFPQNSKALGCTIVAVFAQIYAILMTFSYNFLVEAIGMGYYFCAVSLSGILCLLYTYFSVPETKGKSFYEIQKMLEQ